MWEVFVADIPLKFPLGVTTMQWHGSLERSEGFLMMEARPQDEKLIQFCIIHMKYNDIDDI